jgi:hypothetical protein
MNKKSFFILFYIYLVETTFHLVEIEQNFFLSDFLWFDYFLPNNVKITWYRNLEKPYLHSFKSEKDS